MSVSISGGGASAGSVQPPPEYVATVNALRDAQTEMTALVQKQAAAEAQLNENTMVKIELDALKEGEPVYKLHGKILVRQDVVEAKGTVEGRLNLINNDLKKTEAAIEAAQQKMIALRKKASELQASYAKAGAAAGK